MSRFSGRMTDSHGMSRDASGRITADSRLLGTPKAGRNKGVLAALRATRREEADERDALTPPERTAAFRRAADAAVEANLGAWLTRRERRAAA